MLYDIIIIGGGPSGMMAAYSALKENKKQKIALLEKNNKLGNKLLLTGGGRCNITNTLNIKEQIKLYSNKNHIKPALHTLTNQDLLKIFEKENISFKTEEKGKIYPKTEKSETIKETLEKLIETIDIYLNSKVKTIEKDEKQFTVKTKDKTFKTKKVIIACGGITYPKTGSNGDGYRLAKSLKHNISNIKPGLASLKVEDEELRKLSGLKLKNVSTPFKSTKRINEIDDVLITHLGLSGPGIINLSSKIMENMDYDLLKDDEFKETIISIDFIPKLNSEELKSKIENDIKNHGKLKIKTYLKEYMPFKFINYFTKRININLDITLSEIRRKDKNKIIENLKKLDFKVKDIIIEDAKITIGGINIEEINNKTLESKIVPNLYFAGEILDSVGPTGGFNLQLAFSTGYLAGYCASRDLS